MVPRIGAKGGMIEARGRRAEDQAHPPRLPLVALVLVLGLAGCSDRLADLDPRPAIANVFGAHLEGRPPPPGLDQPWPRLSSVPDRPPSPSAEERERLSAGLVADRDRSRIPLGIVAAPPAAQPGPAAAGPPPPPRLAAAPPIRLDAPPEPRPAPIAPAAAPVAAPAPGPEAPPAPPPALLAPPPPPSADLLAPRRD
jgi:hypothetical protein